MQELPALQAVLQKRCVRDHRQEDEANGDMRELEGEVMSKYEPITAAQTCGTCRYLSRDFVLTSYPEQAICTLYNEAVFVNCETCLDDLGRETKT